MDRYHTTLVMKLYTPAWLPHLAAVRAALSTVMPARRLILRLSRGVKTAPGPDGAHDGQILSGPPLTQPVQFLENHLSFEADPVHGQKTGFFLDQRDNRARLQPLCRGRSVLDAFAYTGAFSVYAARGGADQVLSIDASHPALAAAQRNMALNRRHRTVASCAHRVLAGDAFDILERLRRERRRFGVVILDPPSFAKTRSETARAVSGYRRLTRLGLAVLERGGALMQSSCSSHVDPELFFSTIRQAAGGSGRRLRDIEHTGHALDHPVRFKEGAYLKALFAIVD